MDDIRAVLSPLLLTSNVFGIRIIQFTGGYPRLWCHFLYILLLWSVYHFLLCTILHYVNEKSVIFQFCFWLNHLIALLSVVFGIYHDKKYRTCLRKLAIVDDTLVKIGITTDYQKLYTRVLFIAFGWFAYIIWRTSFCTLKSFSFYNMFIYHYTYYVNILDDLIVISILGYIELKFEHLNEFLRKLVEDKDQRTKRAWEHFVLLTCQTGYSKFVNSEYTTWIIIHLHLELRKISRELNSIFGLQMTFKMATHFAFLALNFCELFNLMFVANYKEEKSLLMFLNSTFVVLHILRLFIINYMCERVSVKANATGDIISKIPYSSLDVIARENISLFLLHLSLRPLKFYGLGLFQFGLKFFYGFSSSLSTVIVILVQSHTNI